SAVTVPIFIRAGPRRPSVYHDTISCSITSRFPGSARRPTRDTRCHVQDDVLWLATRIRAHPVRGQGRDHLSKQAGATTIFFQPDVRTRALLKGDSRV